MVTLVSVATLMHSDQYRFIHLVRVAKQAGKQAEKQAEISVTSQQPIADAVVTDENKQAEPAPVVVVLVVLVLSNPQENSIIHQW